MTKDELVKAVAHELKGSVPAETVEQVVNAVGKVASESFEAGENIEILGLGMDAIGWALRQVRTELQKSIATFPELHSLHEGYALIQEELDDLWDEVKVDDETSAVDEALQVAAVAVRFAVELGLED
ncbi:HU family DNA-binding protein [Methylocaldum sp.]|uniref:HU family DNA-binding protein n=1 Tax=Methylocaldum sp. TaxID=1969727 RepID=UPI002D746DC2|nr:HU family DNA-binding protein [Methylocaldum sp.]HYE35487.1 HU family DNA-binding protein [Methylocaldum sp.]